MAAIEDFLPDVQPYCKGVPASLAERALLHAARAFCSTSGYWRASQRFTTVTDESASGEYTLTLAPGTELVSVMNPVYHSDTPIFLKSEAWLSRNYAENWRTLAGQQARHFTMAAKAVVRLVPYPTAAVSDDLRVPFVLRPALTAPTIDTTVQDEWSEQIGWGAIARLKAMPDEQWSDEQGAVMYAAKFEEAKNEGQSRAIAMWQDRRFQRERTTMGHYF